MMSHKKPRQHKSSDYSVLTIFCFATSWRSEYCKQHVCIEHICMFLCLCICPHIHLWNETSPNHLCMLANQIGHFNTIHVTEKQKCHNSTKVCIALL